MGKELVSPLTASFMSGTTSPVSNYVEGSSTNMGSTPRKRNGGKGGKKCDSIQGQGKVRMKGTSRGEDIQQSIIGPEEKNLVVRGKKKNRG
jgi:hypothetical protein